MFGIGPATRVYLAAGATDMRKGFEGLYGLVRDLLQLAAERTHFHLLERTPESSETAVLGWQRAVGLRQTLGEGALPLA